MFERFVDSSLSSRTRALRLGLCLTVALDGCASSPGDAPCPEGRRSCGECIDVQTDVWNCGSCGSICDAGAECREGACVCLRGHECGGSCVDLESDPSHCGGCDVTCGGGLVCSRSACKASCDQGLTLCGASCVEVATDPSHCGECGVVCEPGQLCASGQCACSGGRVDCGAGCTDLTMDLLHCGECGRACGEGSVCAEGECVAISPGAGGAPGAGGGALSSGGAPAAGGQSGAGGSGASVGGSVSGGASAGGAPGSGGAFGSDCEGKEGFSVRNGKLYDKNCREFVLRGVNYPYTWFSSRSLSADLAAIAKVGANSVRVVMATGARWTRTSGAELTSILAAAKANKLIVVLEVHDMTGYAEQAGSVPLAEATSYWTASEIVSALLGQEAYAIINIANEPNGNDTSPDDLSSGPDIWAPSHAAAVQVLRSAGLHHTLMIDGPHWGQDWRNVMREGGGKRIWDADPDKNLIFSVHMYDVYGSAQTVTSYFNRFLENNEAPLVVGEFAADHGPGKEVDEGTIMMFAESLGIGYMGWSWSGNGDGLGSLDITQEFNVASLTAWGNTLVHGPFGLMATSETCSVFE